MKAKQLWESIKERFEGTKEVKNDRSNMLDLVKIKMKNDKGIKELLNESTKYIKTNNRLRKRQFRKSIDKIHCRRIV